MDRRIYHGPLNAREVGQALVAQFNRGNLRAQQFAKRGFQPGKDQCLVVIQL